MKVILDANVLYPATLRDMLLSLANNNMFQPKWSTAINEEWVRNLIANRLISKEKILKKQFAP
jgi:predicted nucleic acid-binding protein